MSRMEKLDNVVMLTRQYFVMEYHAGTRYMVERYIFRQTSENVDPLLISAALRVLKDNGAISQDHRVWFFIADK
jgi:hypothetical protein